MTADRDSCVQRDWCPGKLWSLWDLMKKLNARPLLEGFSSLKVMGEIFGRPMNLGDWTGLPETNLVEVKTRVENLRAVLVEAGADLSLECVDKFLEHFNYPSERLDTPTGVMCRWSGMNSGIIGHNAKQVIYRLPTELGAKVFMIISKADAALYDQDAGHFGDEVDKKFPDAIGEISEAGKCLALRRSTATVFHLMRAMELAVAALAGKLNVVIVNKHGETLPWGLIQDKLRLKIAELPKGAEQDEWHKSQALLFSVNRAFRTKTAHPRDTYTEEEAENAFGAVRSFMQFLATRM